MKVRLEGRVIPRNKAGDPCFTHLGTEQELHGEDRDTNVLAIFSAAEITELVNRALYQLEYQKESHRTRSQAERDKWAPVKAALKIVHPHTPFAKATEQQLEDALRYVRDHTTTGS